MKNIFITCYLFFISLNYTNAQWVRMGAKYGIEDASTSISGLEAIGDTIIYLDGNKNVYASYNNGFNWKKVKPRMTNSAWGGFAHNSKNIYTIGNGTTNSTFLSIYFTNDFGQTWKEQVTPIKGDVFNYNTARFFNSDSTLLIFDNGPLYKKTGTDIYNVNLITNEVSLIERYPETTNLNLSKNRISYIVGDSFFIKDRSTKNILYKNAFYLLKGTPASVHAVDSIIVATGRWNINGLDSSFHFISADLGRTWNSKTFKTHFEQIQIVKNRVVINNAGNVFTTTDYGRTWSYITDSALIFTPINHMVCKDSTIIVANSVTFYTALLSKKYNEKQWSYLRNVGPGVLYSKIIKVDSTTLWGGQSESYDNGFSWRYSKIDYLNAIYIPQNHAFYYRNNAIEKSTDLGGTWQIDTTFYLPSESAIDQAWVNGDTIIMPIKQPSHLKSAFHYSSKKSHKKDEWEVIQTNSDIIKWKVYDGNIYYSSSNEFSPKIHRYNLKTKTDSVITVNSKSSIYVEDIIVEGNKIWANTTDSLVYSDNMGKTWKNIYVPFAKPFYFVFKIDEFLLITKSPPTANPRDGEPDNKTFGIYISKDNGQSWTPFTKGIYLNNSNFSPLLQKIDDNIYLYSGSTMWRVNMNNLRQNYQNSISGYVFDDINNNGVKDNNEPFLKNIKVSGSPKKVMIG